MAGKGSESQACLQDRSLHLLDNGRENTAETKEHKSRIPRPVYSSVDPAIGLDVKRLQNGAEVLTFHENNQGFVNQAYEGAHSSSEVRKARYQGKYTSYEEMLADIDDQNPFQAHPVSEDKQQKRTVTKRSKTPSQHHRKKKPLTQPICHGHSDSMQETMNVSSQDSAVQRRLSNVSTGTFTVTKADSHSNLIIRTSEENALTEARPLTEDQFINDEENNEEVAHFVRQNQIKMRQCCKYIKAKSADQVSSDCCCGRVRSWHDENNVTEGKVGEKWSVEEHTETLPTTCFGTICFQGFGHEATKAAPYIRIDKLTKPDVILTLLYNHWKMPKPKLIISVTGGAKRFFLKNRLKHSFKRGLVNVAMTTGAWIITGGTNTGVMEFVGEAVKEYALSSGISDQKLVVLGIATWGIVDNKESLMPPKGEEKPKGLFPAYYNYKDLYTSGKRGVSPLDNNHTHFILVDDGREKKFGAEIMFRAEFENYVSKANQGPVPIPAVLLVLEGGENTIKTALEAVQKDIPVVIIQGSGRAADVIAFAVKYFKKYMSSSGQKIKFAPQTADDKPIDEMHYTAIREKVEDWLDWIREEKSIGQKKEKVFQCVKNIELMLQKTHLLTVFFLDDIDTTNEIDQAILLALLKARRSNVLDKLNLALAWNHCDIARQEIFNNENRQHWRGKIHELYDAMFTAMIQNKIDFVQLFLDNGVELKDFLTVRRLRELYDEIVNDQFSGTCASLLLHLLQREQSKWQVCCCHQEEWQNDLPNLLSLVGKLICSLTGEQFLGLYEGEEYLVEETITVKSERNSKWTLDQTYHSTLNRQEKTADLVPVFPNPERDLMFWAILLNRKDLAHLFWKLGKDHIGGALTASTMFKNLSRAASREEELDLSNELKMHSEEFEELATGVLNECYQRDKMKSHKLLIRSLDLWGDTTIMSIAENAEHMTLMGHSSCQTKLNKIWIGKMALYTSVWKIILGLVFFPFIIPTIRFTMNESGELLDLKGTGDIPPNNQIKPATDQSSNDMPPRKNQSPSRLYRVGEKCNSGDGIKFFHAMYLFHTAPLVKFCYHTLSYICFLGLFCFFLLTNMRHTLEGGPTAVEYLVWVWAGTMLLEEFRQVLSRDPNSLNSKLMSYFSSLWNRFDMTVYGLLIITVILRFQLPIEHFVWARRFYAVTLTMFFLRFMQTYYVEKNMGPKVIMIKKMLTDLVFFVLILAVFVLGYGVAIQALRFPNAKLSWNILKNVVYIPYWNIYGELFLDELQSDVAPSCPVPDPSNPSCPEDSWLVMILLALYMVFTNVLLLNLLIAMFSYTFERVQQNSEKVWRFHRYGLIYEYFDKPTLAPPLIIFTHIFRLMKYLAHHCAKDGDDSQKKQMNKKQNNDFYQKLSKRDNDVLTVFERIGMENYLIHQNQLKQEHIQNKVTTTGERIDKVIEDLEQIKETVIAPADGVKSSINPEESTDINTFRLMSTTYENVSCFQDQMKYLQEQVKEQHFQMQQVFSMITSINNKLDILAQSQQQGISADASQLQWDNQTAQIYNSQYKPHHDDIIPSGIVPVQQSPSYQRVKRQLQPQPQPQPQVEIQEFPPGYTNA